MTSTTETMIPMESMPAMPPPPGVVSNFIDPPSRQPDLIAVAAVFTSLMLLAVSVRLYTRIRILKNWGWDDSTCMLAVIGSLAMMAIYMKWLDLGLGRHMWDVPVAIFMSESNVRFLSSAITYPWTVLFTKLSILFLYRRFFQYTIERFFIWAGVVIVGSLYLIFVIMAAVNTAQCVTLGPDVTSFCQFMHTTMINFQAGVNVGTDFYLVILPIPRVLKLQLSLAKKIGLCLTFASGLGACGASLARLITNNLSVENGDSTWVSAELAMYSLAEVNVGIIVACVCTFPPFFNRVRESKVLYNLSRRLRSLLKSRSSRASDCSVLPLREKQREEEIIRAVGSGLGRSSGGKPRNQVFGHAREIDLLSTVDSGCTEPSDTNRATD